MLYPDFIESEATAEPDLGIVLHRGTVDHGPEGTLDRAREDGSGLGRAGETPALLLGRLVEPGFDVVLPRLVEVIVGDLVVVLRHLLI